MKSDKTNNIVTQEGMLVYVVPIITLRWKPAQRRLKGHEEGFWCIDGPHYMHNIPTWWLIVCLCTGLWCLMRIACTTVYQTVETGRPSIFGTRQGIVHDMWFVAQKWELALSWFEGHDWGCDKGFWGHDITSHMHSVPTLWLTLCLCTHLWCLVKIAYTPPYQSEAIGRRNILVHNDEALCTA